MAQSALSSLFFVIVYVSALSADSIEWRKKGTPALTCMSYIDIIDTIIRYIFLFFF
jgi:hypothetical protein